MMGIFSFNEWKEFAIELLCSNERCKSEIVIDSRKVDNLIYCSRRCAKEDGLKEIR